MTRASPVGRRRRLRRAARRAGAPAPGYRGRRSTSPRRSSRSIVGIVLMVARARSSSSALLLPGQGVLTDWIRDIFAPVVRDRALAPPVPPPRRRHLRRAGAEGGLGLGRDAGSALAVALRRPALGSSRSSSTPASSRDGAAAGSATFIADLARAARHRAGRARRAARAPGHRRSSSRSTRRSASSSRPVGARRRSAASRRGRAARRRGRRREAAHGPARRRRRSRRRPRRTARTAGPTCRCRCRRRRPRPCPRSSVAPAADARPRRGSRGSGDGRRRAAGADRLQRGAPPRRPTLPPLAAGADPDGVTEAADAPPTRRAPPVHAPAADPPRRHRPPEHRPGDGPRAQRRDHRGEARELQHPRAASPAGTRAPSSPSTRSPRTRR